MINLILNFGNLKGSLPITVPHQNVTYDIALSPLDEDISYAYTGPVGLGGYVV
ncbi:MAG: hypothetical protein CM1200mP10_21390 [Candidatus Neomarinimicrobiota bacterium]|nr:MAG: hypothetical protein CM1200mP10_21390 [Candidatus Neomarinimicrobiota bacterium]